MKPFIFQFLEKQLEDKAINLSQIEYSRHLNLSVLKATGEPAISALNLGTQTLTKAGIEGIDTDRNDLKAVGTMTLTRANIEGSDHDHHNSISMYLATQTTTLVSSESVDSDANRPYAC